MKHFRIAIAFYFMEALCESYLIGLGLSTFPKKPIEFNDSSLGKINLIRKNKKYFLKKHTKYFFNDHGELKLGGGKSGFIFEENFFGTQIKSGDLCLTVELGNLVLSKCCTEDEFCCTRQSFQITYFNNTEESSFAETDGEDLIDRFQEKYPNFREIESDVLG